MGTHLIDGDFQSDKYPTTPRGKVPLSTKDKSAQSLLWEYAQRRRTVDAEFSDDLETALKNHGFIPPGPTTRTHRFRCNDCGTRSRIVVEAPLWSDGRLQYEWFKQLKTMVCPFCAKGPLRMLEESEEEEPRQLQHQPSADRVGGPCARCGLSYSTKTAYVPCFKEDDTLETWYARQNEAVRELVPKPATPETP